MSISRISLTVLVALAAISIGFYEYRLKEVLKILGNGRVIESVGNGKCTAIHGVEACESEYGRVSTVPRISTSY